MSKLLTWIDDRFPLTKVWNEHLAEYYTPKNFNFWYYFGSLAMLVLVMQILTGIWLTMHYKPDADTTLAGDHWPTLREFFETNGDDCDGLDLIAYGLLRESGFRESEIYRLIVRRDYDGANHMVSVWFEDPADPWVIDATGAMSREMLRYSQMPEGWTPRMMFNENETYNVLERGLRRYELARDDEGKTEVPR